VLLVGETGAGKTTLALDLVGAGWEHLTDDLCVLESNGTVTAVPIPLSVKSPGGRDGQEAVPGGWAPAPRTILLLPGRSSGPTSLTGPTVVFPSYGPRARRGLDRLSPGRALALLARHAGRPSELHALRELIGDGPAFSIRYGDSREALEFMGSICQSWDE
jgi:hypothetical protein